MHYKIKIKYTHIYTYTYSASGFLRGQSALGRGQGAREEVWGGGAALRVLTRHRYWRWEEVRKESDREHLTGQKSATGERSANQQRALASWGYEQWCLIFLHCSLSRRLGLGPSQRAPVVTPSPSECSNGFGSHLATQGQTEVRDGQNQPGAGHG